MPWKFHRNSKVEKRNEHDYCIKVKCNTNGPGLWRYSCCIEASIKLASDLNKEVHGEWLCSV